MSLLTKGGISRLSELIIDADKPWAGMGISNIKELALAMAKGDLLVRGNTIIQKLGPGTIGQVLTSAGAGHLPTWQPGAALELYFPAAIELALAFSSLGSIDHNVNESGGIDTDLKQAYGDAPADMIKRLTPSLALVDAQTIETLDFTQNKNTPIDSECAIQFAVGGAVLDESGVGQTDFTAEINDATPNDVELLPPVVSGLTVGDCFYFGLARIWHQLWLTIGTIGGGNYSFAHEYYNADTTWHALPDLVDNTNEFQAAGRNNIHWSTPANWALTAIMAMNLYWIRCRVTAVASYTTQPLGTQGWCEVIV